jgi:CDP-diglyceride synthetase
MMRFIRLSDYTWWIWLSLACCLLAGLLVDPIYFFLAIFISTIQAVWFLARERSVSSFPLQLRLAYLLLLLVLYVPPLRFLYWVPAIGTLLLCFSGYCLLARCLSLLPWNRNSPLTLQEVVRTFSVPPNLDATLQGRPASGCPGGVCSLEVQIGKPTKP